MSGLISKVVNYIDKRYLKKYVDNRSWQLVDDADGKVSRVMYEQLLPEVSRYYPDMDLRRLQTESPAQYAFFMHLFERYVYRVENCIIDPYFHWVILSRGKVFRYSYPLIEDPWDTIKPRPSLLGYLLKSTPKKLDKGILVKYHWTSYFHFFIDTLPQLYLCDDMQIPADVPLIVPHYYADGAYVREYLKHFPLKRRIIVQEKGQYLDVKELYVAKDVFCNKYYPQIRQRIIASDIAASEPSTASPELLFIKRKEGLNRTIKNSAEIEEIARETGFTVVEPGDHTWTQQVKLFSNARAIIGIHGAGLTNILFCKNNDVRLFELFPGKGVAPEHYRNMCINLGFRYTSLLGNGLDSSRQFHIDKEEFRKALKTFLHA